MSTWLLMVHKLISVCASSSILAAALCVCGSAIVVDATRRLVGASPLITVAQNRKRCVATYLAATLSGSNRRTPAPRDKHNAR